MSNTSFLTKTAAVVSAAALALSMAACGGNGDGGTDDASTPSASVTGTSFKTMSGITATGTLGEKPEIHFDSLPYETHSNEYAILQEGDGAVIEDGQRICTQNLFINTDDGSELSSSWDSDPTDCTVISSSTMAADYVGFFIGQKIHTTIALSYNLDETGSIASDSPSASASNSAYRGLDAASLDGFTASNVVDETEGASDDSSASSSSSSSSGSVPTHYIWVFTLMSAEDPVTHATGTEVTDLPDGLPTVTRAASGEPSIDLSTYNDSSDFVSQTLIEGDGETVEEGDTIEVQYSGWLTDGTQFDSSWSRGQSTSFSMDSGVIKGFEQGLVGHTVGSQVLLIVPPDMGYGDDDYSTIPGGSTLIFVVDILYKM